MAQYGWRTNQPVSEWLFAEAYRFDFFQAVKLLEALRPDAVPLGEGGDAEREAVRIEARVRLDFAASDIESVQPAAVAGAPAHMAVNFFGLAGGEGPLPAPFVELIQERLRARDFALRDFLDIFNHRLLSLLFRAARAHRPALTAGPPERSAAADYLRAFAGLAQPGLQHRLAVPDAALLHYAGLFCHRTHSAVGLERLLGDYFNMPFQIRQAVGRWRTLPPEEVTIIGRLGRNRRLGGGAALGTRVWDQCAGFEIVAGPLLWTQFVELLPGTHAQSALRDLARFYTGTALEPSLRLVLRAADVPAARLGHSQLGWTAWLGGGGGDREVPVPIA